MHHKLTSYFVARHAVRFIPRENGVHFVHVTLDRHHIRGSPFKVIVGEQEPDPGVVTASGKGLKTAETGQFAYFPTHDFFRVTYALPVTTCVTFSLTINLLR